MCLHERVACSCTFLGDEIDDDDDDSDDDTEEDDDDDENEDSDENDGVSSFDELISGFMSGKRASPTGWIPTRDTIMHGYYDSLKLFVIFLYSFDEI